MKQFDYFGSIKRISRAFCAIIFITNLLLVSSAIHPAISAEGTVWSFEEHPHPLFDELTVVEKQFMELHSKGRPPDLDACQAAVLSDYEIYLGRYQKYPETGDAKSNFINWKNYIARQRDNRGSACIFHVPFLKLSLIAFKPFVRNDFYYCGNYSRDPITPLEYDVSELIDEAVRYARFGSWFAISSLTIYSDSTGVIGLNTDVEYYFRKLITSDLEDIQKDSDTTHLEPLLSAERIAFLDKAVANRDYEAVMRTTEACKPR